MSASICFCSSFAARFIASLDLGAHVGDGDDDEPGLAGVEVLTEFLEVVAAHPRRRMAGDRAQDRAARGRSGKQAAADRREWKQRDDEPGREPDPAAQHPADPCRRLVLLDDLGLPALATLDHGRVVGVDQIRLRMEVLHELVVSLGVGDVAVHPDIDHQRVDRHVSSFEFTD